MKNKKTILRLFFTLLLVAALALSMTSCLSLVESLAGSGGSGNRDEGGSGGILGGGLGGALGGGNEGDSQSPEGDSGSEDGESDGGSTAEPPEFYPKDEDAPSAESTAASSKPLLSVVRIVSNFKSYSYSYGGYPSSSTIDYHSEGSGVIYKLDREAGDAYIITNYHVVYDDDSITTSGISEDIDLYLYGQEGENYAISATYIGGSMTYDLAVLKVTGSEIIKNSYALAASIASLADVSVLDEVIAVGNPEGFGISVTKGIVSVDSETLSITAADGRSTIALRVMRVDAAINEGNSGGGLFDTEGNLIGIVNAKRTGEEVDNIGYAIPISLAKNIADSIIYYCDGKTETSFYRCLIGITLGADVSGLSIDNETGKITKVERVSIDEISDTCILKDEIAVGDIVKSITVDGAARSVTRTHHLIDHMMSARVGSTISITVERGGAEMTFTVTIPESVLTKVK